MNYNPLEPIAVFLGPSLKRSQASLILAANYYPPACMGDIYRLLGSGVQIIVLIDGLFHHSASVWPRELLEALDNRIMVIGASSMGALRAAELHTFGMAGYGTIFEWYRAGVIEGDDEVALNHADEVNEFRPFSEPLVNIRYNLWQATQQNCISPEQGAELIEYVKKTYYADRSYPSLFNSPVIKKWPQRVQERLTQFIRQKAVNLKEQDARGALSYCATLVKKGHQRGTSACPSRHRGRYYSSVRCRQRGFLHGSRHLISGEALLAALSKDIELIKALRPELIKNYFLLLWAKQRKINCPADYLETYRRTWQRDLIKADYDPWLGANGLTDQEFQAALAERALLAWLVDQGPTFFGLDFAPYVQFVELLLLLNPTNESEAMMPEPENPKAGRRAEWLRQASEICCLATWAGENGIVCPPAWVEEFIKKWAETHQIGQPVAWLKVINLSETIYQAMLTKWAGYDWLIEKGPLYFGYTSWSFEVALLKELQVTGQAARFVEKIAKLALGSLNGNTNRQVEPGWMS